MHKISKTFFILSLLVTIWFFVNPVVHSSPCSCPATSWHHGSVVYQLLTQTSKIEASAVLCSKYGCSFAYKIIPTDLIALSVVFLILFLKTKPKFRQ